MSLDNGPDCHNYIPGRGRPPVSDRQHGRSTTGPLFDTQQGFAPEYTKALKCTRPDQMHLGKRNQSLAEGILLHRL